MTVRILNFARKSFGMPPLSAAHAAVCGISFFEWRSGIARAPQQEMRHAGWIPAL